MKVTIESITVVEMTVDYGSREVKYRRHGPDAWEELMGESWEPAYFNEDVLESIYQCELRANQNENSI